MSWKITFFNIKVEEETLSFPSGILANLLHILGMIEEFGPAIGKPHTAPMRDGLFEIRAKGKVRHWPCSFLHIERKRDRHFTFLYQKVSKDP